MKLRLLSLIFGISLITVGCESPTESSSTASASLSFVVGDNSGLAKALSGHVTVSSAKVLLRTIQFHSTDDSDSLDFKSEAVVVDLDLTGGLNTIGPIEIPQGAYNKVSFRLHKLDDGEDVGDADFVEGGSGSDRYSVVVSGSIAGTAFTFKSRRTAKQRVEFDPPLVIDDATGTVNVTLSVDVNSWFVDFPDGGDLDPNNPDDESNIDNAISKSFRGFVDNDKSGD
jgi:hypothetical protein